MTLTSNEKIRDAYIRHQSYLLRYAGGLRNEIFPNLMDTEQELYDAVVLWLSKTEGARTIIGAEGRKWQAEFAKIISDIRLPAWSVMLEAIQTQLRELSISEAAHGLTTIEGAVPVVLGMQLPPVTKLLSIVNSQPFEGATLKEWMERTAAADVTKILRFAKIGITQGQTPTSIARRLIGTKSSNYRDGVTRKAALRNLESVLLTVTNGIQNEAKQALYQVNSDIIASERFVNTLDARTTIECIASGQKNTYGLGVGIYPMGKGPMPPLHFRCRSLRVPYLGPESFGNRPFNPTTEKQLLREYSQQANISVPKGRESLPRGHKGKFDDFARMRKRQLIGTVPSNVSYGEFLKGQSAEFQNDTLGVRKAELFRSGKIGVADLTDVSGRVLTYEELLNRI